MIFGYKIAVSSLHGTEFNRYTLTEADLCWQSL